jgi:cytochrome c
VACGNNRASVSQFVAGIGHCPIAARRPILHNIIGRKAGSLPNYGYSSARKGADFVWDKETLDSFIAKPDEVVSANNMKPYGGLASADDRSRLIAVLQSPGTN